MVKVEVIVSSLLKATFHDTDTDILNSTQRALTDADVDTSMSRGNRAHVGRRYVGVSGESVSVSKSVSLNAALIAP